MSRYPLPVNGSGTVLLGTWVNTGGSRPTILADGSDATFVKKSSTSFRDGITFPMTNLTVPTNEIIRGVRWTARLQRPGSTASILLSIDDTGVVGNSYSGWSGGIVSLAGPWLYKRGSGATLDWDAASLNALQVTYLDKCTTTTGPSTLYEIGVEVDTASVPLAPTVSAPGGTSTDTSTPAVVWTHNDIDLETVTFRASSGTTRTITTSIAHGFQVGNDVSVNIGNASYDCNAKITAVTSTTFSYTFGSSLSEATTAASGFADVGEGAPQAAYQVRIFTAAQYGAGGFDPATSAATWESGQVLAPDATVTPSTLANATYRAYVRTAKTVNGNLLWSPYAFSAFTVTVVPPTVTLAASWDSANNRVQLTVAGTGNMLTAQDSAFETAGSVGAWITGVNCTLSQSTTFADNGTGSLLMSSNAAGTMSSSIGAGGLTATPVLPSTAYSARARLRAGSVARTCTLGIAWYNAAGTFISTSTGTGVADATGAFTTITVTATSPASAAFGTLIVTVTGTAAAAELHYVDAVSFHPGSTPAYSPGGQTYSLAMTRTPSGGVATPVRPPLTLDIAQKAVLYDYEAIRGLLSTWSVALVGTSTLGTVTSAAVTATATTTNDGTWWLKAVAAPTLNRGGVRVITDPDESRDEAVGVFRLDGRPDPVVVAGQTFGDDFNFEIYTSTAAEFEAIKALVVHQGALLVQEPFVDSAGIGLQRYVRIIERKWTKQGVPGAPRRRFTLQSLEVGKGY